MLELARLCSILLGYNRMGVLEIIAERRIGATQLASLPALRASIIRADRAAHNAPQTADERSRIESIVDLCFEYEREPKPNEKANILRTLEEISANAPLEAPSATVEEWEQDLKVGDPAYARAAEAELQRLQAFRKKYFSLRAKAGLETQAAVAKKSGLRRSYVAVIETGSHFPQQKTLQKLAKALGVDLHELLP
ncbi:MAG: XRE family transcriptional regulator [Opitutus sp.]|nr:XRE family transcriptional regulator [Opitutus sp.]